MGRGGPFSESFSRQMKLQLPGEPACAKEAAARGAKGTAERRRADAALSQLELPGGCLPPSPPLASPLLARRRATPGAGATRPPSARRRPRRPSNAAARTAAVSWERTGTQIGARAPRSQAAKPGPRYERQRNRTPTPARRFGDPEQTTPGLLNVFLWVKQLNSSIRASLQRAGAAHARALADGEGRS